MYLITDKRYTLYLYIYPIDNCKMKKTLKDIKMSLIGSNKSNI